MKKILYILFSGILIIGLGLAICWTVINFNKVEDGLSGAGIYTEEDLNNSYNDGYNTALSDKEEYTKLIDSYRDTITSNTDEISKLNNQVSILTKNNKDYASQISDLETQKITLEEQVVNLTTIKTSNETTISLLEGQVSTLQKEVDSLNADNSEQASLIKQKNIQIINLQNTISQLQKTNELNLETINNLNNQITSLNTQITSMSLQIQNNSTNVTALNNKIAELEKSVAYYEQYIANLEVGEQIVITFEFNGSVYNIQIINKNATVSVVNPTSTDYVVFNGWTVDDNFIDLNTYSFTSNTKVVADITYKYDVKFMIDDSEFATQIVTENNCPVLPTNPTKNGFVFDGWTLNGFDIVSPDNTIITENTIFIAKFTKLHTVTFVYEDSTYSTQTIRNNECPTNVIIESTDYKIFNGWTLNSVVVDVTTQKIVSNTTFVADITYKYDVKFMVDDSEISSQIILENDYPVLPTNPTKNGFVFDGWTLNGFDIVSPDNTIITENTTFIAKFTKLHTVTFVYEDSTYSTQTIRNNECPANVIIESTDYKIFNGWTLNGNIVDVTIQKITSDTVFVADIIYIYEVKFVVDGSVVSSQNIVGGKYATAPTSPSKLSYKFNGWSIDGTNVVNISNYPINSNLTFVPVFSIDLPGNYHVEYTVTTNAKTSNSSFDFTINSDFSISTTNTFLLGRLDNSSVTSTSASINYGVVSSYKVMGFTYSNVVFEFYLTFNNGSWSFAPKETTAVSYTYIESYTFTITEV